MRLHARHQERERSSVRGTTRSVLSVVTGRLREDDRRFFDRTNEQERIDCMFAKGRDLPGAYGCDDAGADGKEGEIGGDAAHGLMTDIKQADCNLALTGATRQDEDGRHQDGGQKRNKYDCGNSAHATKVAGII